MQFQRKVFGGFVLLGIIALAAIKVAYADIQPSNFRTAERRAIEQLNGSWDFVKSTVDGDEKPLYYRTMNFNEIGVQITPGDAKESMKLKTLEMSFAINPQKSPQEITIYGDKFLVQGIYRIDGNTLKIAAYSRSEVDRPTTFESDKNQAKHLALLVWTMKKPEK